MKISEIEAIIKEYQPDDHIAIILYVKEDAHRYQTTKGYKLITSEKWAEAVMSIEHDAGLNNYTDEVFCEVLDAI
jgi:hypothetical protein